MNPDLETVYQKAFAELTQQVEKRFSQLEQQLGALASPTPADDLPASSGDSGPRMLTVDAAGGAWAFPLSSISHFAWGDDCLRVFLVGSSGEKQVELRFRGEVSESLRPLWEEMAANIANGSGPLRFPCELGGGEVIAAVK